MNVAPSSHTARLAPATTQPAGAPAVGSPLPADATQTELAARHLSKASRKLLPDALLDARIGRSTLAGSLNDQVRFRVARTGDPKDWQLLPDSPTTAALMQTRAGAGLVRQLRTAMESTGHLEDVSNLKGFILAEDTESVLAGRVLSWLDAPEDPDGQKMKRLGELNRTKTAGRVMRSWGKDLDESLSRAGAWNAEGWITFVPDTARAMLTASGGYAPRATEQHLREAKSWTRYLSGNGPHEVQHSVSDPSPTAYEGTARWVEEGTANVMTRTPVYHGRNARRSGLTPERYAAMLSHEPSFEPGWGTWTRPTQPPEKEKETDEEQARNYGRSQVVLRDLARLAGVDFRSKAGQTLAYEILQRKSMRFTPGVIADALIERHGLEPKVRERLRDRIKNAVDIEGGVRALAREFGITREVNWES